MQVAKAPLAAGLTLLRPIECRFWALHLRNEFASFQSGRKHAQRDSNLRAQPHVREPIVCTGDQVAAQLVVKDSC